MYDVLVLKKKNYDHYINFIEKFDRSLIYHSIMFKNILEDLLNAESNYLICMKKKEILAVLPLIKIKGKFGIVINSLPFFGSNGGVISRCDKATQKIMAYYNNFLEINKSSLCSSTIISTPFLNQQYLYEYEYDYIDKRFSQISILDDSFKSRIEKSALRNVQKAKKNNIYVEIDNDSFDFLYESYFKSMNEVAWKLKEKKFFDILKKKMKPEKDYNLYVAKLNNKKIASLLLLYFNKTVEYFTPTVLEDYLNLQPMALILNKAIDDAKMKGYKYWNWGGTWFSQKGVFRFKKKWGAEDSNYNYFTKVFNEKILNIKKEELMKAYPYFYVIPFEKLPS